MSGYQLRNRTYEERLAEERKANFDGPLRKILELMQLDALGYTDEGLSFSWNKSQEISEAEQVEIESKKAQVYGTYIDKGVITPETVHKELSSAKNGFFHQIGEFKKQTKPASSYAEDAGVWREEDHPRDDIGRFTEKGQGTSGGETESEKSSNIFGGLIGNSPLQLAVELGKRYAAKEGNPLERGRELLGEISDDRREMLDILGTKNSQIMSEILSTSALLISKVSEDPKWQEYRGEFNKLASEYEHKFDRMTEGDAKALLYEIIADPTTYIPVGGVVKIGGKIGAKVLLSEAVKVGLLELARVGGSEEPTLNKVVAIGLAAIFAVLPIEDIGKGLKKAGGKLLEGSDVLAALKKARTRYSGVDSLPPEKLALIEELKAAEKAMTDKDVLDVVRTPSGTVSMVENGVLVEKPFEKIAWLEKGNPKAGLEHIIEGHAEHFKGVGIKKEEIVDIVMNTVENRVPVYVAIKEGHYYEFDDKHMLLVVIANNGFIVNSYPVNMKEALRTIRNKK